MNYNELLNDILKREFEEEWFEFKENWYNPHQIGEYISALSNSSAVLGKDYAYFIWGIDDNTHVVKGTSFDFYKNVGNEPLQNYLARMLRPSIAFSFEEFIYNNKRLVILKIPAAVKVPTSFDRHRYFRIGSSKIDLENYPDREALLWNVLSNGYPSMINTESPVQNLTFNQLFLYYGSKGLSLRTDNYVDNLILKTNSGKYNILAYVLADNGNIPIRVAIFSGKTKFDKLYSVKECGNVSILYAIDNVINYANSINMVKSKENLSTGYREDIYLFDQECFNEAVKNAFIHNKWITKASPMISFFIDRVEITSFGSLAPGQTIDGFYKGHSVPVNEQLSNIFLQTHVSERTGKGVPTIVNNIGQNAFEFNESTIVVNIPFKWINKNFISDSLNNLNVNISKNDKLVLIEIKNNPHLSQPEIAIRLSLSERTIQSSIKNLKDAGIIERVGSNKTGYWKIIE